MLSIKNKEPWAFWPTRVCPSFFKLAGNQVISGKYNFKLELDFTLKKFTERRVLYFLYFLSILRLTIIMSI